MAAGEMFGAAIGVDKALETQRETTLGAMKVMKELGEIEGQPGKRALEAAHARYYRAAAGEKEAEAAEELAMRGAAEGGGASLGDPIARLRDFAYSKGFIKRGIDLEGKRSTIALREQQISTSGATQELRELQTARTKAERNSSLAASAVDQGSYDWVRMLLSQEGEDVSDLPESFEGRGRAMMEQVVTSGMRATDVLGRRESALVAKQRIKTLAAQEKTAGATASAAAARAKVSGQTYDLREKYEGDTSGSVKALRGAREKDVKAATVARGTATALRERTQLAREAGRFPAPTAQELASPEKRTVGKTYFLPKGAATWSKEGWIPLVRPPGAAEPLDDDDDDEGE